MLNKIFIDTRSDRETSLHEAPGARPYSYVRALADVSAFCDFCRDLKDSEIVFVCRSGRRSKLLKKLLAECNFDTEKVSVMRLSAYLEMAKEREAE
jgi:rhodanese-related sulfurtransferase